MHVLLILFLGMFVEFWLIVTIAKQIGVFATLGTTVITAVIGLALVRRQGLQTLARAQAKAQHDESPAKEMIEGLAIFFAGVFLFIPGFVSDTLGFALLIPGVRGVLCRVLLGPLVESTAVNFRFYGQSRNGNRTFEGEFEREDTESSPQDEKNQKKLP